VRYYGVSHIVDEYDTRTHTIEDNGRDLGGEERADDHVWLDLAQCLHQNLFVILSVRALAPWSKDMDHDYSLWSSPILEFGIDELGERVDGRYQEKVFQLVFSHSFLERLAHDGGESSTFVEGVDV
jgi:hypothetical protein